mmetsp:Transcript_12323/g.27985  ORF Transcript_12323/g.27985 Transcript_12323/m.27985 type:complete len:249 (-) Transcript_12323:108-854(-)
MANIMLQTLPQVRNSIMKAASWTSVSDAGDSSSGDWIPRLFCLPEHVFSGCMVCNPDDTTFECKPRARWTSLQAAIAIDPDDGSDFEEGMEFEVEQGKVMVSSEVVLPPDPQLDREIEEMQPIFASHDWTINHRADDRWVVNGRSVRLFRLPEGIPKPSVRHIEKRFPPDVAQHAVRIMVNDGPLMQPILDYLLGSGQNEHYDHRGSSNPGAVRGFGRGVEMAGNPSDRLEAMRLASLEASVRREADH